MKQYLRRTAFFFRYAWLFSLFVNLAMLTLPLYMLQVYDRVLASRSLPTLAMLTLGAAFVYAVYVGLEMLRSRVLVQASVALDRLLGAQVLGTVFAQAAQPGGERHAGAVRDVATPALVSAIRSLKAMGSKVVFVTHEPWLLADADRLLVLHAGSVAAYSPRDEVLARGFGRSARDAQPASAT